MEQHFWANTSAGCVRVYNQRFNVMPIYGWYGSAMTKHIEIDETARFEHFERLASGKRHFCVKII